MYFLINDNGYFLTLIKLYEIKLISKQDLNNAFVFGDDLRISLIEKKYLNKQKHLFTHVYWLFCTDMYVYK